MVVNHIGTFGSSVIGNGSVCSGLIHGVSYGIAVYGNAKSWLHFFLKKLLGDCHVDIVVAKTGLITFKV